MARRIGEIMVDRGLIGPEQLHRALEQQVVLGGRLGTVLVQMGLVKLGELARCLSAQHGVPEATGPMLEQSAATARELLSRDECWQHRVCPLAVRDGELHLAMATPLRVVAGQISLSLGYPVRRYVVPELRLVYYLERFYAIERPPRFLRVAPPRAPVVERRRQPEQPASSAEAPADPGDEGVAAERRRYVEVTVAPEEPPAEPREASALDQRLGIVDRIPLPPDEEVDDEESGLRGLPVLATERLDVLLARLRACGSGRSIAQTLVEPFAEEVAASVLFWVRDGVAVGTCAHGARITEQELGGQVLSLQFPSLMRLAWQERLVLRAEGNHDDLQRKIAGLIGLKRPGQVLVAPLSLGGRVLCLLCAYSRPATAFSWETGQQQLRLVRAGGEAYGRVARKRLTDGGAVELLQLENEQLREELARLTRARDALMQQVFLSNAAPAEENGPDRRKLVAYLVCGVLLLGLLVMLVLNLQVFAESVGRVAPGGGAPAAGAKP